MKGHGVAEIILAVCDSSAIEAYVLGVFGQLLYLLEFLVACHDTEMP